MTIRLEDSATGTRSLMDDVQRVLVKAGHPRATGKRAGFKLVGRAADEVEVRWLPETRRRTQDRWPEALAAAIRHAETARAAGWGARVVGHDVWPVCRITRPDGEEG